MNKQQCLDLIAGLAHRECLCKCSCPACTHECMSESGQSKVLLGDVLEKMKDVQFMKFGGMYEVVELWYDCGFTKSLQEMLEFEMEGECIIGKVKGNTETIEEASKKHAIVNKVEYLKDPNARELFEFLNKIFYDK